MADMCITRSAGQSNSSADDLVSRLEEGSNKWPKASLQVLHRLWSEHGASVHAQQKLQATLSISQVCPNVIHSSSLTQFQIFFQLSDHRLFCLIVELLYLSS